MKWLPTFSSHLFVSGKEYTICIWQKKRKKLKEVAAIVSQEDYDRKMVVETKTADRVKSGEKQQSGFAGMFSVIHVSFIFLISVQVKTCRSTCGPTQKDISKIYSWPRPFCPTHQGLIWSGCERELSERPYSVCSDVFAGNWFSGWRRIFHSCVRRFVGRIGLSGCNRYRVGVFESGCLSTGVSRCVNNFIEIPLLIAYAES